jgi:hypothetical protein
MQEYSAKNANLHPSMVTLPQFPLPCMFFKYAVPLLQTDVLTVTWEGQLAGLPGHHPMLLSSL